MQFKSKFVIFIIGICLFSCSENEGDLRMKVIHEKVAEKITNHRAAKKRVCRKKVLKKAGAIADSILLAEARLKRDTSGRPFIPLKPNSPEIKDIVDTLPVEPFFRDSTLEWRLIDSTEIKE